MYSFSFSHELNEIKYDICLGDKEPTSNSFTSTIVSDLILPKFDLNGFLSQSYMRNQHTIRKKLFQFHLRLIEHIDEPLQRKRALNDLSRGLLMVF